MAFGKVEREFVDELVALVKRAPSGLKVLYGFVSPETSELAWGAHNMTHLDAFGIAAYIKAEAYRKILPIRLRLRNSNNENNNLKKIYSDAIMFLYEYKPILEDTIKSWEGRSREHVHNEELITLLKTIEFFESKIKDNGKTNKRGTNRYEKKTKSLV